jgi:hypothetical protein
MPNPRRDEGQQNAAARDRAEGDENGEDPGAVAAAFGRDAQSADASHTLAGA